MSNLTSGPQPGAPSPGSVAIAAGILAAGYGPEKIPYLVAGFRHADELTEEIATAITALQAGVIPAARRRRLMSIPGGDSMTIRYHRDADVAQLKREKVRRPIAWRIHPADAAELAAEGQHCQTRRCLNLITIVTWRWWRSSEAARILMTEHFRCDAHGQEFADRYHVGIEPSPGRASQCRQARKNED